MQDDWKLSSRLTLNLGLRYDLHPGWFEQNDKLAIFHQPTGQIVVADGGLAQVSPLLPANYVNVVTASSVGLPSRTVIRTDTNNVAPRIGAAFKAFRSGDTVIRGGYGIYYDSVPVVDFLSGNNVPFVINEVNLHQHAADADGRAAAGVSISRRDASLADPAIQQWFDPTAFGAPPIGRFGNAERGSIEGPGLNVWHVGFHKTFTMSRLPSAPTFRVDLTSTNFFNHPNWANPNTNVTPTNVNAGRISATGGPTRWQQAGARSMRLGVRVEW